jgi:hypothetical protein
MERSDCQAIGTLFSSYKSSQPRQVCHIPPSLPYHANLAISRQFSQVCHIRTMLLTGLLEMCLCWLRKFAKFAKFRRSLKTDLNAGFGYQTIPYPLSTINCLCVLEAGTVGHFWDRIYKSNVFNNFRVPAFVPHCPNIVSGMLGQ